MKTLKIAAIALCCLLAAACDKETDIEPGGTNMENMAGFWDVTVDAIDNDGNVTMIDPYGMGVIGVNTYNTADNNSREMWLDDLGNFWAFKFVVPVDYSARTFACDSIDYDEAGSGKAIVRNGKILTGAAKNLHGMPNDSIVFDIAFSDDTNELNYRVSGQRHTGFVQ